MATIDERNARLDRLEEAVKNHVAQQKKNLQNRVDTSKKILRGRTGSERLAQTSVSASSSLVVEKINNFLTGT